MKKVDMIVKAPFFYTMQGEGVGFQSGVAMVCLLYISLTFLLRYPSSILYIPHQH